MQIYLFVAAVWFYQEWDEHGRLEEALIRGFFWPFEVIKRFTKPSK